MDNFALRRTGRCSILGPDPDGLLRPVRIASRRDVVTELVAPSVLESAAVWKAASVSERGLLLPDLNDREHSKDHLRGETDGSGERSVAGK